MLGYHTPHLPPPSRGWRKGDTGGGCPASDLTCCSYCCGWEREGMPWGTALQLLGCSTAGTAAVSCPHCCWQPPPEGPSAAAAAAAAVAAGAPAAAAWRPCAEGGRGFLQLLPHPLKRQQRQAGLPHQGRKMPTPKGCCCRYTAAAAVLGARCWQ